MTKPSNVWRDALRRVRKFQRFIRSPRRLILRSQTLEANRRGDQPSFVALSLKLSVIAIPVGDQTTISTVLARPFNHLVGHIGEQTSYRDFLEIENNGTASVYEIVSFNA